MHYGNTDGTGPWQAPGGASGRMVQTSGLQCSWLCVQAQRSGSCTKPPLLLGHPQHRGFACDPFAASPAVSAAADAASSCSKHLTAHCIAKHLGAEWPVGSCTACWELNSVLPGIRHTAQSSAHTRHAEVPNARTSAAVLPHSQLGSIVPAHPRSVVLRQTEAALVSPLRTVHRVGPVFSGLRCRLGLSVLRNHAI